MAARPLHVALVVAALVAVPTLLAIPALFPAPGPVLSDVPPPGAPGDGAARPTGRETLLRLPQPVKVTDMIAEPQTFLDAVVPSDRVFIHNKSGLLTALPPGYPPAMDFRTSFVGFDGPEPSVGVDVQGRIFFQALLSTMRSSDNGASWQSVTPIDGPIITFDPYLWLDTDTGRVYDNHLIFGPAGIGCSWSAWSDNAGNDAFRIWTTNPRFCSAIPEPLFVDHQKVHTGPIPPLHILDHPPAGINPLPVYPNAVFFAWNNGQVGKIAMSLDGGLTFPIQAGTVQGTCDGGLHGRVRSSSEGVLFLPKRDCDRPLVFRSLNFNTWENWPVGEDVGSTDHRKNPDIALDTSDNVYVFWNGADEALHMTRSTDLGENYDPVSIKVSPPLVLSTVMPSSVAGSPGRIATMYYGTMDSSEAPDHVPDTARWHAYVTFSLNALDPDPTFVTIQLSTASDPIQIGCVSTRGDNHCGNQNLLDFTDIVLTPDGRVVAAWADGCTVAANCADNPAATNANSDDEAGMAGIQLVGPNMYGGDFIEVPRTALDSPPVATRLALASTRQT